MRTRLLHHAIDAATKTLARAGVGSPRADAELLAAHAAGTDRGRLALLEPDADFVERFEQLVAKRAERVPLQHLTGTAAFGSVTVQVGPGVFIPRPETESLLEWALAQPLSRQPLVVDLCTGSAALALALWRHRPGARVIAVDDSDEALAYARRNVRDTSVELLRADVTTAGLLSELDGTVDLLVANPPYIPDGAQLEPEVAQYDPPHALFGGEDGMAVVDHIAVLAARLLRPGGSCAVEHDDSTSQRTVEAFTRTGRFVEVTARHDLTGRPRFVTAVRGG
ncbi:peptide chain release factor N(5)-glutamine methyltransferase [Mycolicibacterium pyrenivorans]|uniref:peptide chain release factor N(5)-glutamine methyltransferase n=1 Tax=Mycolicibacterium pyrenivorans TaxID=187102 RepID=UPI0021F38117|nr:peptide chain release factor N(5)-glutamine methyltransferase [Mycolicibacterium pyrenivorans]MCV7151766.1 peptide chain release factor N(5)-glutamine methyltransferase [Mycolicibacterium pyrenivorans]